MKPYCSSIAVTAIAALGCSNRDLPPTANSGVATQSAAVQEKGDAVTAQWPFADAENTAVITLKRIMDGSKPILYVVHDADGDWQFLDGDDAAEADAAIISLQQAANLDSSIKALADLPTGWAAERTAVDQPWQRRKR